MLDTCTIWQPDAKFTQLAGASLASTLYSTPLTITLSGELGAGKTTFLQGFFTAIGIKEHVTSPTYALEQRYDSSLGTMSHIDLYRLNADSAHRFLDECDEATIQCIEWPERSNTRGDIEIQLQEDRDQHGRKLTVTFHDQPIPPDSTIELWRSDAESPAHIIEHCNVVADTAVALAKELTARGMIVRLDALRAAAKLHDLLRLTDNHEAACASFLQEHGFNAIASMVATHGTNTQPASRKTIEQKLLYYADKRVMHDTVVSVQERFDDFKTRYTEGRDTPESVMWLKETLELEQELFPDGPIL